MMNSLVAILSILSGSKIMIVGAGKGELATGIADLNPGAEVFAVEKDMQTAQGIPKNQSITVWMGPFQNLASALKIKGQMDVVVFQHDPRSYAKDFKLAREQGLIGPGTVIITKKIWLHRDACTDYLLELQGQKIKYAELGIGTGMIIATI